MGATFSCCPKQWSSRSTKDKNTEANKTLDRSDARAVGSGGSFPPGHRQCTIDIKNKSSHYTLHYVGHYIVSGFCALPLPLEIEPSSSGSALYSKTAGTAEGAVGVFTCDLNKKSSGQTAGRMAVMFSVPFDFDLYSNWYAVGVFYGSTETDKDLFDLMYYGRGDMFTREKAGNRIDHNSGPVDITAFMTDTHQPTLSLEVRENLSKRTER